MTTTERPKPRTYTMADLTPIMEGLVPVPNLEEMEPSKGLELVCLGGWRSVPDLGKALIPGSGSRYGGWARYFLATGQGGGLTGEGVVIWSSYGQGGGGRGRVGTFAICRHIPMELPGANHKRGWHPAACSVCGLDLSTDSGD